MGKKVSGPDSAENLTLAPHPVGRWAKLRPAAESLALHAALLVLAMAVSRTTSTPIPRSRPPIQVSVVQGPMDAPAQPRKIRSPRRESTGHKAPRISDLGVDPTAAPRSGSITQPGNGPGNGKESHATSGDSEDGYAVSNAMGIQEEAQLYPFFSALWKKIDSATGYPEFLVQDRTTGFVTAQVEIDRRGVFTGRLKSIHSDQPLLEAYALAVLFHALAEPLPQNRWSTRDRITLVAHFDFHTFTWGEVPPPQLHKELKNVLEFERYGYVDPKLNQDIERYVTRYLPPIIPVPGGFFIDFYRAYKLVQNLRRRGEVLEEDLRAHRAQLELEQWRDVVRKSGETQNGPT